MFEALMKKWGEGSTKNGALLLAVAAMMFPDIDTNMIVSSFQDWWQATVNLYELLGNAWVVVAGFGGWMVYKKEVKKDA